MIARLEHKDFTKSQLNWPQLLAIISFSYLPPSPIPSHRKLNLLISFSTLSLPPAPAPSRTWFLSNLLPSPRKESHQQRSTVGLDKRGTHRYVKRWILSGVSPSNKLNNSVSSRKTS